MAGVVLVAGLAALVPVLALTGLLLSGSGADLVAGFSAPPKEQQGTWDRQKVSRFVGALLLGSLLLAGGALAAGAYGRVALLGVLGGLGVCWMGGGILYLNRSRRFRRR